MSDVYWTTKDNGKILVDDMSEQHLKNVLKMLLRNKQKEPCCCFQKHLIEEEKRHELRLQYEREFYEWDNYGTGGE